MSASEMKWFGDMSIDEVSKTLGVLQKGQEDLTKLTSKLFSKMEERDEKFGTFRDEFKAHVAEEKAHWAKVSTLEDDVTAMKPMATFAEECAKREAEKTETWQKLKNAIIKAGVLGAIGFAVVWVASHVVADLQSIVRH